MGTLDSREYDRLVERNFGPYSEGHRKMYDIPIAKLAGRQYSIVEAGFGIGYGLDRMIDAEIVDRYVGYEPNADSFRYVRDQWPQSDGMILVHAPFSRCPDPQDIGFCIEVIEHVPMDDHAAFLADLRASCERLFFSTPCVKMKPNEGVRETDEWVAMLRAAGFASVSVDKSQWTYLYECE